MSSFSTIVSLANADDKFSAVVKVGNPEDIGNTVEVTNVAALPTPSLALQGLIHFAKAENTYHIVNLAGNAFEKFGGVLVEIGLAASDETTDLTTGTAKITFRMPFAMTLNAGEAGVRGNVNTAPTGSTITVDINEGGSTILSTKLTIAATSKTSVGGTPPVISDVNLADDGEITIDIDGIGSTIAGKGLKIWLIGTRA